MRLRTHLAKMGAESGSLLLAMPLTGISILPVPDGTVIHPTAAERTKFCSSHKRPAPALVHGSCPLLRRASSTGWSCGRGQRTILLMKSKVHPKYKTTYRVGNWREYERALVQRGDVTLWLSAAATDAWRPSPSGRPGGQKRFSDVAIETALILRLVFGLPLRQTEGFVRSVLALMGADLDAPDHTTLSRRSQQLAVMLRRVPATDPIHLIVDSTGLSIVGQGAWAAAKHGGHGERRWKKLHLGVDQSGVIVAQTLTDAHVDDATTAVDLIPVVDGDISRVTADAAYDTIAVYEAAGARGAQVVVPPKRTAAVSRRRPRSLARDRTVKRVQEIGRRRWKKETVDSTCRCNSRGQCISRREVAQCLART